MRRGIKLSDLKVRCWQILLQKAVIPVLNQYKSIGCSPGKHPDTRTRATGSDDDSRDIVHDRCLCIAALLSVRVPKYY